MLNYVFSCIFFSAPIQIEISWDPLLKLKHAKFFKDVAQSMNEKLVGNIFLYPCFY